MSALNLINTALPKSGLCACISSRITTVIHVVSPPRTHSTFVLPTPNHRAPPPPLVETPARAPSILGVSQRQAGTRGEESLSEVIGDSVLDNTPPHSRPMSPPAKRALSRHHIQSNVVVSDSSGIMYPPIALSLQSQIQPWIVFPPEHHTPKNFSSHAKNRLKSTLNAGKP